MEKTLQLTAEDRTYTDKATGQQKSFKVFVVKVNGIPIQLKPTDLTSRSILEQYFNS